MYILANTFSSFLFICCFCQISQISSAAILGPNWHLATCLFLILFFFNFSSDLNKIIVLFILQQHWWELEFNIEIYNESVFDLFSVLYIHILFGTRRNNFSTLLEGIIPDRLLNIRERNNLTALLNALVLSTSVRSTHFSPFRRLLWCLLLLLWHLGSVFSHTFSLQTARPKSRIPVNLY